MARLMGLWNCSSRATLSAAACVGRVVMVGPNYTRLMSMSRVSVLRQRALLLGTRQAPLSGVRALSTVARRKVPFTKHNNKVEQPTKRRPLDFEIPRGKVQLVEDTGVIGLFDRDELIKQAHGKSLQLVQVAFTTNPDATTTPVVRITTPAALQKKQSPAYRATSQRSRPKILRFKSQIAEGDVQVKVDKMIDFLSRGLNVQVEIVFERHKYDNELAQAILENVISRVSHLSKQMGSSTAERDQLVCHLVPKPEVLAQLQREKAKGRVDDDVDDSDDGTDDDDDDARDGDGDDEDEDDRATSKAQSGATKMMLQEMVEEELLPTERRELRAERNKQRRLEKQQREEEAERELARERAKEQRTREKRLLAAYNSIDLDAVETKSKPMPSRKPSTPSPSPSTSQAPSPADERPIKSQQWRYSAPPKRATPLTPLDSLLGLSRPVSNDDATVAPSSTRGGDANESGQSGEAINNTAALLNALVRSSANRSANATPKPTSSPPAPQGTSNPTKKPANSSTTSSLLESFLAGARKKQ